MGNFLARYGAIEFAGLKIPGISRDGSGTYETVKASSKSPGTTRRLLFWPQTKTKPSDATLADFRALRTKGQQSRA